MCARAQLTSWVSAARRPPAPPPPLLLTPRPHGLLAVRSTPSAQVAPGPRTPSGHAATPFIDPELRRDVSPLGPSGEQGPDLSRLLLCSP